MSECIGMRRCTTEVPIHVTFSMCSSSWGIKFCELASNTIVGFSDSDDYFYVVGDTKGSYQSDIFTSRFFFRFPHCGVFGIFRVSLFQIRQKQITGSLLTHTLTILNNSPELYRDVPLFYKSIETGQPYGL